MKIKVLSTATLLILISLSACSGNAPQTTPEPVPPIQAPTQPEQIVTPTDTPASIPTETPSAVPATTSDQAVSFANDIVPILNTYCVKCHGVERIKEGLDMTTYDNLMAGSFNGPVVTPGNADGSLLVELVTKGKMPERGPKVTPEELQKVIHWINQGAINN